MIALVTGVLSADIVTLDGLAAKVNDTAITIGDVSREVQRNPVYRAALADAADNPNASSNTYMTALNALIDRELILEAAADKKMEMQEWVIENRIREIVKDNFDGDRNRLIDELAHAKTPYNEWYDTVRESMIVEAMRYTMVDKNFQPTPALMEKEYRENPSRYAAEACSTVNVILFKPPADDDTKTPSVATRAAEVQERLAKGEAFDALAKQFSSDPHAQSGGLWKDVKPEEAFTPEIAAVITSLKPGETSGLTQLDGGWAVIVRKDRDTLARARSFEEAYDDIARNLRQASDKANFNAWLKRLREAAYIKYFPMPTK